MYQPKLINERGWWVGDGCEIGNAYAARIVNLNFLKVNKYYKNNVSYFVLMYEMIINSDIVYQWIKNMCHIKTTTDYKFN